MLISETTKNGTKVELRRGTRGDGRTIYVVQTERVGSQGQTICHQEKFLCILEAKNWIKWIV